MPDCSSGKASITIGQTTSPDHYALAVSGSLVTIIQQISKWCQNHTKLN